MTLGYNTGMSKEIATPQQIDRDLAEKVCGFRKSGEHYYDKRGDVVYGFSPTTFRDDAHEVLAQLTDEQWQKFTRHLVPGSDDLPNFAIEAMFRVGFSSTPAQIAEAVWRATC